MTVTRIGLQLPSFVFADTPDDRLFERIAATAVAAEESGFDSLWVMDHLHQILVVGPETDPMLEGYTLLAGIAARTQRVGLGTMVTGVTYRNPALLAKIVTTLDVVSAGRAILGIGAAWNEDEHKAYGYEFPPVAERFERLEDTLRICAAMFSAEPAPSYDGRRHSIAGALNNPKPVRGRVPILVGGSGERRTLRLVAEYADACNLFGDLDTIRHKLDVLERHCADVGRDPAEITRTKLASLVVGRTVEEARAAAEEAFRSRGEMAAVFLGAALIGDTDSIGEQVAAHRAAGLDGLIVNLPLVDDLDQVRAAGEVMAKALA
ncbi:MAG: LLM class F420-dependent oxidoreductase [Acidimicrobiia bacterium]